MSAEDVAGFRQRFANRTVHIYVSGAIKLADLLKIDEFAIVVKGKELNAATNHSSPDGWRYKKLKDGSVYIAALALQDLCVAEGMEKTLPLVQNMCNPRLEISYHDGRLMARINRQLLLKAGDVEQNPGPSYKSCLVVCLLGFLVYQVSGEHFQIVSTKWNGAVELVGQWCYTAVDWIFGDWLDEKAYECAIIKSDISSWKSAYNGRLTRAMIRIYNAVPYLPTLPRLSELSYPVRCSVLEKVWRFPTVVEQFSIAGIMNIFAICCYVSLMGLTTCCVVIWRVATGGVRRVRVINHQKPFIINDIKDAFRAHVAGLKMPKRSAGAHKILAFQRRAAEEFCFNTLLEKFERVRDVGGSRSRWPELGYAKHVCCPVVSNDDILRNDKDRTTFENCGKRGEDCPHRRTIPAAVISHVDYHMTVDQLTRTVTGPTFIINHDFTRFNTGVGRYQEGEDMKYEATVEVVGSKVSMTPDGGTPYLNHPFHNWLSEASAVSANGAFTYVRLGDLGETSVYYCHPSDGVYNINDENALTTSAYDCLPNVNGYSVVMDENKMFYRFSNKANRVEFDLSMELIDDVALTMSSAPRNEKYGDTLRSYLLGKMKAKQADTARLSHAYGLTSYLSDLHAVKTVPFATCIQGHPVNFTWFDIVRSKLCIWLTHFTKSHILRSLRNRLVDTRVANRLAPWMFSTISVPTYEVYMERSVATCGTGRRINYSRNPRFPNEATAVDSCVAERGQFNSCENAGEHAHVNRDPCVEHGAAAITPHCEIKAQEPDIHTDVESTPTPMPRTVVDTVKVAPRNCTVPNPGPKTIRRSAYGKFEGLPVTRPNDDHVTNPIVQSELSESAESLGAIKPSVTVLTYDPRTGAPERIIISPTAGADECFNIPSFITDKLGEPDFEIEDCLLAVNDVVNAIEKLQPKSCDRHAIIKWCLEYFTRPTGKCSDKSSAPKGSGLLPTTSVGAIPKYYRTIRFRDLGIAVPPAPPKHVARSSGESTDVRIEQEGCEGQEFLEDRNKRKTGRSTKYFSKKR